MMKILKDFFNDEAGATAIEYALIAAVIGVTMAVGAGLVGDAIDAKFDSIVTELS